MTARRAVVRSLDAPRVRPLDDLVRAVRAGDDAAKHELFERFAPHLLRVLARILGTSRDLPDVLHDTFVEVLGRIDTLREPDRLPGWMVGVAVNVARHHLRRRRRRSWLWFLAPEDMPEIESQEPSQDVRAALHELYAVLAELGPDERIAFALRRIEGMTIEEIAASCDVSVSTIKRRVDRADAEVAKRLRGRPHLASYLPEGGDA